MYSTPDHGATTYGENKPSGKTHQRKSKTYKMPFVSKWMVPIAYGIALISWVNAFRCHGRLTDLSTSLEAELHALAFQKEESIKTLRDAVETKEVIQQQHKKLKRTQRLFKHERRMKEEILELKHSSDAHFQQAAKKKQEPGQSGVAVTWIQQRQEALFHKIYSLQLFISETSQRQVHQKYGHGPYRVEFSVMSHEGKKPGTFLVELAPLDMVPHSIETFLDMVTNKLWDNTVFYHHETQDHVVAAAPVNYGTFETKHYHFDALGYTGVSYPEYSPSFPHEKYTVGFSGTGPNFYINTMDNTKHHGPGGQGHHGLPTDADPCFGKIVSGFDVIDDLMMAEHAEAASGSKNRASEPVSWHDYDLTRIVSIRLLENN